MTKKEVNPNRHKETRSKKNIYKDKNGVTKTKPAKQVRRSKKVEDFIIDKMESEGMLIGEICRKYPTKVPSSRSIRRWATEDESFYRRVTSAYDAWAMVMLEELNYVSNTDNTELYPNLDFKEAAERRRARIDAIKFMLAKMAPVLSNRFDKVQKIEHSGESVAPQIVVTSYATPNNHVPFGDHAKGEEKTDDT